MCRTPLLGPLVGLALTLALSSSLYAAAAPKLTFAATTVTASGFSPGGQVVWWTSAREVAADYYTMLTHHQTVAVADSAGQSIYAPGGPVPPRSMWIAVDLATGAYALDAPGSSLLEVSLPPGAFKPGAGSAADLLTERRSFLQALLVRPGLGAWETAVGDGGPADEDGLPGDGGVAVSLANLRALTTGGTAPTKALAQDLLVVLDPLSLEVAVTRPGVNK